MNQTPAPKTQAPDTLRSYEDKDSLYFDDYCRGLGDPDVYGYPGEPLEGGNSGRQHRLTIDPKPF